MPLAACHKVQLCKARFLRIAVFRPERREGQLPALNRLSALQPKPPLSKNTYDRLGNAKRTRGRRQTALPSPSRLPCLFQQADKPVARDMSSSQQTALCHDPFRVRPGMREAARDVDVRPGKDRLHGRVGLSVTRL